MWQVWTLSYGSIPNSTAPQSPVLNSESLRDKVEVKWKKIPMIMAPMLKLITMKMPTLCLFSTRKVYILCHQFIIPKFTATHSRRVVISRMKNCSNLSEEKVPDLLKMLGVEVTGLEQLKLITHTHNLAIFALAKVSPKLNISNPLQFYCIQVILKLAVQRYINLVRMCATSTTTSDFFFYRAILIHFLKPSVWLSVLFSSVQPTGRKF